MSVEKLVSALYKEAELKEKALLANAEDEARKILDSAKEKARETSLAMRKLEEQVSAMKESARSARKRMAQRNAESERLNDAVARLFDECMKKAREFMKTPRYTQFVEGEYARIKDEFPGMDKVKADPATASILSVAGDEKIVVDKRLDDGFIAFCDDGAVRVYCLFHMRLEKLWRAGAPDFVKRLSDAAPDTR